MSGQQFKQVQCQPGDFANPLQTLHGRGGIILLIQKNNSFRVSWSECQNFETCSSMGVFPCAGKVNEGIQQWGVGCVWKHNLCLVYRRKTICTEEKKKKTNRWCFAFLETVEWCVLNCQQWKAALSMATVAFHYSWNAYRKCWMHNSNRERRT